MIKLESNKYDNSFRIKLTNENKTLNRVCYVYKWDKSSNVWNKSSTTIRKGASKSFSHIYLVDSSEPIFDTDGNLIEPNFPMSSDVTLDTFKEELIGMVSTIFSTMYNILKVGISILSIMLAFYLLYSLFKDFS